MNAANIDASSAFGVCHTSAFPLDLNPDVIVHRIVHHTLACLFECICPATGRGWLRTRFHFYFIYTNILIGPCTVDVSREMI